MHKPAKSVIASARVLIGTPSIQKMPDETLRLLLHQILEKYTAYAVQENKDFYTNEEDID